MLALLLNEVRALSYKKLVQTVSYLPHFVSWVVISGLFFQLLSPSSGIVNRVVVWLGHKPVFFLPTQVVPLRPGGDRDLEADRMGEHHLHSGAGGDQPGALRTLPSWTAPAG